MTSNNSIKFNFFNFNTVIVYYKIMKKNYKTKKSCPTKTSLNRSACITATYIHTYMLSVVLLREIIHGNFREDILSYKQVVYTKTWFVLVCLYGTHRP